MDTTLQVKLELVRPGPAHNQLLSPLTDYVALCGAASPNTFSVPIEHRELLRQLRALTGDSDPERRRAQLDQTAQLGEGIFASIDAFKTELGAAGRAPDRDGIIHLRLVVTPSELAIIPFEAANLPQGLPGEKLPLALQAVLPVTITRETRDCQPPPKDWWKRRPRILVVAASPPGLAPVPIRAHLLALRRALEPWLRAPDTVTKTARDGGSFVPHTFAEAVTVLPAASLRAVREACAAGAYTHVHILAHGLPLPGTHDERFGIALHSDSRAHELAVVSGRDLVLALRTHNAEGCQFSAPLHVTLASCDSGNVGGVVAPGASIAHELHSGGIPWVVASQFPLSFAGSAVMAEVLYQRLLRGDDPRCVLHDLRQRLSTECSGTNDWAALVAYAAIGDDFEQDWARFASKQNHRAIDTAFFALDAVLDTAGKNPKIGDILKPIQDRIALYTQRFQSAAERSSARGDEDMRSEAFGMMASNCKRSAQVFHALKDSAKEQAALKQARTHYRDALEASIRNHWVVGQYLALFLPLEGTVPTGWWHVARASAEVDLKKSDAITAAWAHGSLAELYLLALASDDLLAAFPDADKRALDHARRIVEIRGFEAFEATSTRRQFRRYADWWIPAAVDALRARADTTGPQAKAKLAPLEKTAKALVAALSPS
ncbi:MAG: CHAT domain-containing protein [Myxococcota bacterium]